MNDGVEPAGKQVAGEPRSKPNNLRTGLLLGALALFFFALLFIKRLWLG
jgi:hypothetical protein